LPKQYLLNSLLKAAVLLVYLAPDKDKVTRFSPQTFFFGLFILTQQLSDCFGFGLQPS